MRAVALEAAMEADILKVSATELALMAGTADIEEGAGAARVPQATPPCHNIRLRGGVAGFARRSSPHSRY